MLIREKFTSDGGTNDLFTQMQPYLDFLTTDDAKHISGYWILRYGNLELLAEIEPLSAEELADDLVIIYGTNWENMQKQFALNIVGTGKVTTIKETKKRTTEDTDKTDRTSTDSTTGYNDNELQTESQNVTSDSRTGNGKVDNDRDYTKTESWTNAVDVSKNYVDWLSKNRIYDIIIRDINRIICNLYVGGM